MRRRRAALAIVGLLSMVLVALPAVPACGGGQEGNGGTLLVGVLADLTGTAAPAMRPAIKALEDYLGEEVPNSDHPLPGNLKVEFTHFDTRLEYSETTPGYLDLKDRGVKVMVVMNAVDRELLGDTPETDSIPTIGAMGLQSRLTDEWMLTTWSPVQSQAEVEMLFIMDDWDYAAEGRSPKVGHLGSTLLSSTYYQEGIQDVLGANPGQFTWAGFERGRLGTEIWGSEVSRLKGCDYIIASVPGSMLSSFVAQARDEGYAGKLITGMEGFPGFWPLVSGQVVSRDHLHGCYYVGWWPWWNEDVPMIRACRDYIAETYAGAEAEELSKTASVICGRELGMVLEETIRNAAKEAGVEDLDGPALKDGMRKIDVQIDGYLDRWQVTADANCLQWSQRAFEYSVGEDVWRPMKKVYQPTLTRPVV